MFNTDCGSLSECSEEEEFREAGEKLMNAWKNFVGKLNLSLPPEQRMPPTMLPDQNCLIHALLDATTASNGGDGQRKWAKAKVMFRNLIQTVNDHRDFLSMLPVKDKYFCLITGSFTAIAKVS